MTVEQDLVRVLGRWGAASTVVGAALAVHPRTRRFGRQTAAWGAVDGLLAVAGARRGTPTDPERLRRVLLLNTGLDVGYLAGAAWMLGRPRWRADGLAVLVQATFLLLLDATSAARIRRP